MSLASPPLRSQAPVYHELCELGGFPPPPQTLTTACVPYESWIHSSDKQHIPNRNHSDACKIASQKPVRIFYAEEQIYKFLSETVQWQHSKMPIFPMNFTPEDASTRALQ
jgi:hypothetical protein